MTAAFYSETLLGDWVCCTAGAVNETPSCSIYFRFLKIPFDQCGEVLMTEGSPKPQRAWREIAQEVSKEHDSDKVAELSEELIEALDKQARRSERMPTASEQQV